MKCKYLIFDLCFQHNDESFVSGFEPAPTVSGEQRERLWREFFAEHSQWWNGRPEKVSENDCFYNSLGGGRIHYSFLTCHDNLLCSSCEEFLANQLDLDFRVVGECKVSRFQAEEDTRGTLA